VTNAENRTWTEIVGVVRDMQFAAALNEPATPFQVLFPLAQKQSTYVNVTLRSSAPETLAEPLRRVIAEMDSDLPVQQLGTVEEQIKLGTNGLSLVSTILATFATLGLLLAALGLYGVIALLVVQRTPEIGVRLALGAQTSDVIRFIFVLGIKLAVIGAAAGLVGSFAIGRLLAAVVPEMITQDLWAIAAATLLLILVALVSCWLPARNAASVDPIITLRAE
jgi:ABC-type antimicrobial peptide transport system permease subunit